jgi:hypothetical protein
VNNALGMLRVATKLGCDAIVSKCAQYLEAVPWEENEEEEILKTLPGNCVAFSVYFIISSRATEVWFGSSH